MLIALVLAIVSTPTNTLVRRPIDLLIPKTPVMIGSGDIQTVISASGPDKPIIFTAKNPSILSSTQTDIGNKDLSISKLPDQVAIGARSLFYRKRNTSTDFVFTDNARKNIYYGTNTSGYPVINRIACGTFSEISDIHLTETASDVTGQLIVADKGANLVYSYVLTPNSTTTLCTSGVSISVTSPRWIQSLTGATPTVYVGYVDNSGLRMRSYQGTDLTAISAVKTVTDNLRSQFAKPILDATSSEILVPVKFADDSVGRDYVARYSSSLGTRTNLLTCRSPEQIQLDFEGASRYKYVFCSVAKVVEVYDTADTLITTLQAGNYPKKISVGSDGTTRYISVLQSDTNIVLHRIPLASPSTPVSTTVALSHIMTDIAQMVETGAGTDRIALISSNDNLISYINLGTQAIISTLPLPSAITSMVAQSSSTAHFVSAEEDTAYTITEVNSSVWTMRFYTVGDHPIQIGYRTNRLYSLNRDSNNLSVINLTTLAVTNLSTQSRPIAMDFDTTTNLLWAANETSQSVSMFSIVVGSEAAHGTVPTMALGFTPQKIKYQSSDGTVYVGGGTTVRALNSSNLVTVTTQTLAANLNDISLSTGGVTISSSRGALLYTMNRSTLSNLSLSSPPHLLTSNGAVAVAGLKSESKLNTFADLSQTTSQTFSRIFSNATNLFTYFDSDSSLYVMPYGLFSSTSFPGFQLKIDLTPEVTSDDGSGNLWMGDSSRLRIQKLTSYLQKSVLANTILNRPEDIATWGAQSKLYIALRNLNAIAIVDLATGLSSFVSVCQTPTRLEIDTAQPKLFVLCPSSDSLSVLTLTAAGAFSSQAIVATDRVPSAMVLNTANNRLYVTNFVSNTLLTLNSLTNALVSRASVQGGPKQIALNTATNSIAIVHQESKYLTQVSSAGTQTNTDTGAADYSYVAIDSTTSQVFAMSPATSSLFLSPNITLTSSGTRLTSSGHPLHISVSAGNAKSYTTFPDKDAVAMISEAGVQTDIAVGDAPVWTTPVDSASKVFVSNFLDDSLSIISTSTDAVTATLSLTSGCGPIKTMTASVSSTLYLYVLCQQNDSIEVINTSSNAIGTPISLRIPN